MHILIVEDEQKLAALVRRALIAERHHVDLAEDGTTGLTLALSGTYDLLILDRMLPGLDGLEICCEVRTQSMAMPILMLTARGAIEDRVKGLKTGADDYLVKPFAMQELLARVEALFRRRERPFEEASILRVGELSLDLLRHEARRGEQVIELTAKEFTLLEFLMRHPRQVLTRIQITDHVWRYDLDTFSNIVDLYIHYLREKIDHGFSRSMIKTVRGVGYKLEG